MNKEAKNEKVNKNNVHIVQDDADQISLIEVIHKIIDKKKLIALVTLVAIVLSFSAGVFTQLVLPKTKGQVKTIIALEFKGIEEGLNPKGELFNINELTCKQVLENTVKQLELEEKGIDSEMLRENIVIQSIMPQEVQEQMNMLQQMAEADVSYLRKTNELEYFPNQYMVCLNITKDMGISNREGEEILSAIINNYKGYFIQMYNEKVVFDTLLTTMDISDYDYAEYILLLDNQLEELQEYLNEQSVDDELFIAQSTGVNFKEINLRIQQIRDIDISNVMAVVNKYGIVKQPDRLISIYNNNISKLDNQINEKLQLAQSIKTLTQQYKKDQIIVMTGEEKQGSISVTQPSETYDELTGRYLEVEHEISKLREQKLWHQQLLDKFILSSKEEKQDNDMKSQEKVILEIGYLQKQLNELIQIVNNTIEDYYTNEMFKNSIKMQMPVVYYSFYMQMIKKTVFITAIGAILGLIFGVMLAIGKVLVGLDEPKIEGGHHEA